MIVLDASATLELLLGSPSGRRLAERLDHPELTVHAPHLMSVEVAQVIRRLAEKTWAATRKTERVPRTVVLKLKTDRFRILTRSHTPEVPPASAAELAAIALALRERVDLPSHTRYRLAGVGLSAFRDRDEVAEQPALFETPLA